MSRLNLARQAVRTGQKARIALIGPSGAGKTWTSLVIARELAKDGKALLIDTEEGSGALYADKFSYDHLRWLPPYDPRALTATLGEAGRDYPVVIVDSLSHFWDDEGGTLDIVDSVAARSSSKNSFAAWKEGTPIQKDMVRAFLRCDAHVIVTMRAKTEYVLEQDERTGRTTPKRVGMAPIQRAGMEYEMSVVGLMELNHQLVIDKSRCDEVADKRYLAGKAGEFGKAIAKWLSTAAPDVPVDNASSEAGTVPPVQHTHDAANPSASSPASSTTTNGHAEVDPHIKALYELAAVLPKTPYKSQEVDKVIKARGLDAAQSQLINLHKLQCGSACPHLVGEELPL